MSFGLSTSKIVIKTDYFSLCFSQGYFVIFGKWSKALPLVLSEKREGAVLLELIAI
jgi:hypothetical protein